MKLFGLSFSAGVMMICCCCLIHVRGDGVCQRKLITRINVTTELESNVLLPCLFDPDLFRSKLSISSSADWSQIITTVQHIVEIKVNGEPRFWDNRRGRIKAFSAQSGSLNFSILLNNVQSSDLGLYQCELFRDFNCSLAYTEISLALMEFSFLDNWQLMVSAAAAGGGFLLLCLIPLCVYYAWIKRQALISASVEHGSNNCHNNIPGQTDEVTYASIVHKPRHHQEREVLANKTPANASEFKHVNSETVLYAAVKRRDKCIQII